MKWESFLLHQPFRFPGTRCPGLCLEQVCLLKYLTCHTCVSWTQSCGIILVPAHTSCSCPRPYPVTPCTGGAALLLPGACGAPRHMTLCRQTATLRLRLPSICALGANQFGDKRKNLLQEQEKGAAKRNWMKGSKFFFSFPPLHLLSANSQLIYAK